MQKYIQRIRQAHRNQAQYTQGLGPVVIVIILAVLLLGGYIAYRQYTNVVDDDSGQEVWVLEQEMANWKTYRNEEYGIEFNYPPKFAVYLFNDKNSNLSRLDIVEDSAVEYTFMRFEIDSEGGEPPSATTADYYRLTKGENQNLVITPMSVNSSLLRNSRTYYVKFIRNQGTKDQKPTFDRILSTFKFTK